MKNVITYTPVQESDFLFICKLYNRYIRDSTITFRKEILQPESIPEVLPVGHARYPAFMVHAGGEKAGFCALTQFRNKEAYDRTAEVLVYLHPEFARKGIGKQALHHLELEARRLGIQVLMGFITAENLASVKLFEKLAYIQRAYYPRIGEKFGRILDVVVYQKELDKTPLA